MTDLKRYKLDNVKAKDYIFKIIEDLNALCKAVLNCTPFEEGEFFTILRSGLTDEKVNELRNGHVGGGVTQAVAKFLDEEFKLKKGSYPFLMILMKITTQTLLGIYLNK